MSTSPAIGTFTRVLETLIYTGATVLARVTEALIYSFCKVELQENYIGCHGTFTYQKSNRRVYFVRVATYSFLGLHMFNRLLNDKRRKLDIFTLVAVFAAGPAWLTGTGVIPDSICAVPSILTRVTQTFINSYEK